MIQDEMQLANFLSMESSRISDRSGTPIRGTTVSNAKSAVKAVWSLLHQDHLVENVMTAIMNKDPAQPRYKEIVDLSKIMQLLVTWGPNDALSLEKLRAKAIILMRICALQRSDDLAKIKLNSVSRENSQITFEVQDPKEVHAIVKGYIKPYTGPEGSILCPMETLSLWINKSTQIKNNNHRMLFIALKPPHDSLSAQRIAKIVKNMMTEAGIHTNTFKAHALRGSAASAAIQGALIDEVFKLGRWSSHRTFQRFYYRAQQDLQMADLIWNGSTNNSL